MPVTTSPPPVDHLSRRALLQRAGLGLGTLALADLLQTDDLLAAPKRYGGGLAPRATHFAPRARAVVMFMQNGGPSQMELFDPKPGLDKRAGKVHTEKVEMFQPGSEANKLLGCPFQFHRRGQCGMELSEVIPHIGSIADDLCLVRSMVSEHNNHTEALVLMSTGKIFPGRPCLGSWISYALGSENRNLPSYIVLRDPAGYNTSGTLLWQNGWMPALYRGTEVSTSGTPILNLNPSRHVPEAIKRDNLDLLAKLNRRH